MFTPKISTSPTGIPEENISFEKAIKETGTQWFTPEQVEKFKGVILTKEHLWELKTGRLTVEELTKLQLSQHKESVNTDHIKKEREKLWNILKKNNEQPDTGFSEIEKTINNLTNKAGNSQVVKQAKTGIEKAKEAWAGMSWKKLESLTLIGWFFEFLGNMLWGLKNLLNFWDKASEKVKELREKLSPEEIANTKKEVAATIEADIIATDHIHPQVKQSLQDIINDPNIINEEHLLELKEKMKKNNGKLTIADIESIMTPKKFEILLTELMSKENQKAQMEKVKKDILDQIYKEYGLNVDQEKRAVAAELVDELISKQDILQSDLIKNKLLKHEVVTLWDILGTMSESATDLSWFFLQLVWKGVISWERLASHFYSSWSDMVQLGIASLPGFTPSVSVETLAEQIAQMDDTQRRLLMWVLYRQWWALAYFSAKIVWSASRWLMELISQTPESSIKMGLQSAPLIGNIEKQNKSYKKLEKLFGMSSGSEFLDENIKQLKTLRANNTLIQILNDAENPTKTTKPIAYIKQTLQQHKALFSSEMIATIETLSPQSTISQARNVIANNIKTPSQKSLLEIWGDFLKNWISQHSLELHKYNFINNVNAISKYQTQSIRGWLGSGIGKTLGKFKEVMANMDIARNMQEINLEGLSKKQALSRMQALWKLAKDMPDLFRTFFGGGLSVAFYGIDIANSEDGWVESILDSSMYIFNVIWPYKLVMNAGGSLAKNGNLEWHEVAAGGAGLILLWIDTAQVWKIAFWSGSVTDRILKVWKYTIRPITDMFSFGNNLVKTGVNLIDVVKSRGDISMKDAIKKWFSRSKNLKW